MIRLLEKISKSSISFSFIYSGANNLQSGSNISSGFGFLAVHFLMKFLAQATNGFYSVVDENNDYAVIYPRNLLHLYNMELPVSRALNHNFNASFNESANKILTGEDEKNSNIECECESNENEENRDSFCQNNKSCMRNYEKISIKNLSKNANATKIFKQRSVNNIINIKKNTNQEQVKNILQSSLGEKVECKCVQKYELMHKSLDVNQIARIRCQEG